METRSRTYSRQLVMMGLLCAISYLVMFIGRIAIPFGGVDFLKYDPKDVVIVIGGFLYGPLAAFLISLVVSIIEMITVSSTGIIGLIMNVLATCMFACPAAFAYKKRPKISSAIAGLAAGVVLMTGMMLLWNYFITPFYMGVPRDVVSAMLVPVFLPFNIIKGMLNAAVTILLYKPIVNALRKAHFIPQSNSGAQTAQTGRMGVMLVAGVVVVSAVFLILVLKGLL